MQMIGSEMVGAWKKNGSALLTRIEVEQNVQVKR